MILSNGDINYLINKCSAHELRGITIIGTTTNPILQNASQLNSQLFQMVYGKNGELSSTNAYWDNYPITITHCNNFIALGIWCGFITNQTMTWLLKQFKDIVAIYQVPKITDRIMDILINKPDEFNIHEMVSMIEEAQYYLGTDKKVITNPTQLTMSETCDLNKSCFTDFKSGRKKLDIISIGKMQRTWRYLPWSQLIAHISITP